MKSSLIALTLALLPTTALAAPKVPAPTADQLGHICYADGTRREITPTDALWLGRMIHGETRGKPSQIDAEAMLWSVAQRSFIWGFPKWELSRLVWSYSQPINPIWTREGSECRRFYKPGFTGEISEECSPTRTELRAKYRAMSWDELDPVAQKAVVDFGSGTLRNPVPGSIGWWDPGYWRRRVKSGKAAEEHEVLLGELDGNSYIQLAAKPDTRGWTTQAVTVAAPGKACPIAEPIPTPASKPSLGSCEIDYTYHKRGRVTSWTTDAQGAVQSLTLDGTGWKHRVCDDATGMIYLGSKDDKFVQDASGTKIKFVASKVDVDTTVVRVTEGKLVPSMLETNRRVVIRVKR